MQTDGAPPSYREAVHQDGSARAATTPTTPTTPTEDTVVSADVVPGKSALPNATIATKKSRRSILLGVAAVVLGLAGFASAVAVALTSTTGLLGTTSTSTAPRNATLVLLATYSGCDHLLSSLRASPGYNPSAYVQLSSRYQASGGGMPEAVASAEDSGGTAASGADSYSTTNVQAGSELRRSLIS